MSKIEITEVRLRKINNENTKVKARGSITIQDAFVVHDVKLVARQDGTLFLAMPSKLVGNPDAEEKQFLDVAHPINSETRDYIEAALLEEYNRLEAEGLEYSLENDEE